ncbi:MAG: MBL fold metallo-hydrolase [Meiothermus sp.]|uniref:MBL fold metallo-hydrolase n=1 Tax=Meiothermus sp. TaxID=1955249 RepID=UPI0028CD6D35|nr:MBL fold metallo-hydrolase [Meiothermus sp.]MDT7920685.1 MBL fold metallo-hydrolase [Meiothermus sp.]
MEVFPLAANTYLLDTPQGALLVDTGMPQENQKLLRHLKGRKPAALLLTHHHLDHVGGARMLWERYGLPIYAHPLDIPYISGERRRPPFPPIPWLGDWIANSTRPLPPEALIPVEEGARVLGWQVVHLPGHTPGQIGLLREGVLLAADALRVGAKGPWLLPAVVNHDTAQARRTVGKMAQLEAEHIYVGHGPPTTKRAVMALAEKLAL